MKKEWYSANCLFLHKISWSKYKYVYEERIIVLRAKNFAEAISIAEADAKAYTKRLSNVKYLNFVQVYFLSEKQLREGTEVFSLMREDNVPPQKYINTFYDNKKVRSQKAKKKKAKKIRPTTL